MFSCLLKRVLPFTLTFMLGATLGWLFNFQGVGAPLAGMTARLESSRAPFAYGYGHGCRMRARSLVAETKPLVILFKPDARWPYGVEASRERVDPARVLVTFGADGKVQAVEPLDEHSIAAWRDWPAGKGPAAASVWKSVERAARQIQFEPEMINGMPVSVTKEVEIHFLTN